MIVHVGLGSGCYLGLCPKVDSQMLMLLAPPTAVQELCIHVLVHVHEVEGSSGAGGEGGRGGSNIVQS